MIELRLKIERAIAHPVWGPVVIVFLAILLALVFIHVAQDDSGVAAGLGAICFGVVSALGAILRKRFQLEIPLFVAVIAEERAPPRVVARASLRPCFERCTDFVLPLRR